MPTLNAQGMKSMRTSLMQFTHRNAAHKYAHMQSTHLYALIDAHTHTHRPQLNRQSNKRNKQLLEINFCF